MIKKGLGSIRKRGSSYQISYYVNGKRVYETVKSPRITDARKRLNEILAQLDKGFYLLPGKMTLKQALTQWLEGYVKTNCSLRTLDGYSTIVNKRLIPNLGNITLKNLQPKDIQGFYSRMCQDKTQLTVHHYHRVLSQALKYAVKQGFIARNPCDLVYPPSPRKKPMRTLTQSEVEMLLETAKDSHYFPIIYTALNTGLRQSELLGLRWRDIDLLYLSISVNQVYYKRGGISVFKEPKSGHSRRRIAMTVKLANYLRGYREEKELQYREILGRPLTLDDLVFTTWKGNPIPPPSLSHAFKKIVRKAGLENVRFHDLRHTFASLLLQAGAKPKVISEALGHSSVAFTMDVYSHIIEGMQSEAMELLNNILPAAENGPKNEWCQNGVKNTHN